MRCNAYCEFCGSRCGDVQCEEVSTEEICSVFREIAEAYDPSKIMINVTGGEPLLRKDLFQVMDYAASLGFPWGMVTNGSLITADVISAMRSSGMKTISISLDGMPETHEALRKIPGGYSRIVEAVQKLREADFLDHLQITTVVNQKNIEELDALYEQLRMLPVDSWRLAVVDPIGRAQGQTQLLADAGMMEQYFAFLESHQFSEKPRITTSCSHYLGKEDNLFRSHSFVCRAGKSVASILANGDIFVCPNVERRPELIQGNIKRDPFIPIWENQFQWFRVEENRRCGTCSRCDEWEFCKGDSLHTWDFQSQEPRFCIKRYRKAEESRKKEELSAELIGKLKRQAETLRGIKISFGSTSGKCVYFTPNASEELYHFFYWNSRHPRNSCELMAGLVGHVRGDAVFAEFLVPVFLEKRGREEAAFSAASYRSVQEELHIINTCCGEADEGLRLFRTPYELVGFAHTHPNHLEAVMSEPDIRLHREMQKAVSSYRISAILNPQKAELCVYWDSVYTPADVILLMDDGQMEKWGLSCSL